MGHPGRTPAGHYRLDRSHLPHPPPPKKKRRQRGRGKVTPIEYETTINPHVALAALTNESTEPAAVPIVGHVSQSELLRTGLSQYALKNGAATQTTGRASQAVNPWREIDVAPSPSAVSTDGVEYR